MTQIINYNAERLEQEQRDNKKQIFDDFFLEAIGAVQRRRDMQLEKDIALLYVLSQRAKSNGHRFRSYSELLQKRDWILGYDPEHDCAEGRCNVIQMPPGKMLTYELTGEKVLSSGAVWVCTFNGETHVCLDKEPCNKSVIDRMEQAEGFICTVTGRYKCSAVTTIPAYDQKHPIGYSTLNRMRKSEDERIGIVHHEGDDYGEVSHEEQAKEFGDDFFEDDGDNAFAEVTAKAERAAQRQMQPRKAPQAKRRKPAKPKEPVTPNEKTRQLLRDMPEKQQLALSIVRMLLLRSNQAKLYNQRIDALARDATAKVNSEKRKSRRDLTTIECFEVWLRHVVEKAPPKPLMGPELNFKAYANSIVEMWLTVAGSPYARACGVKQKPLHFEKLAFALLYTAARGGYRVVCSLPADKLAGVEELDAKLYGIVVDFQVQAISPDPLLSQYLPLDTDIVEVRRHSQCNANPDTKTVFNGVKLLKICINSIFDDLREQTLKQLENCDDKVQILQAYFDRCVGKKLTPTHERGKPRSA